MLSSGSRRYMFRKKLTILGYPWSARKTFNYQHGKHGMNLGMMCIEDEIEWEWMRHDKKWNSLSKAYSYMRWSAKGFKNKRTEVPFFYPAISTVAIWIITTSMTSSSSLSKNPPKKGDSFSKAIMFINLWGSNFKKNSVQYSLLLFFFQKKLFGQTYDVYIWPVSFLTTPHPQQLFFDCTWSLDGLDPNLKKTRDGNLIWRRFFQTMGLRYP